MSDHGRTTLYAQRLLALLVVAVVIGSGCERMPWESHTTPSAQSKPQASQASSVSAASLTPANEQIAVVNQQPLSIHDVELAIQEIKQLTQLYGGTWTPLSTQDLPNAFDLHDLTNNVIDAELKAQDAKARGLDRKTEVQRRLTYLDRNFYAKEWDRIQQEQAKPTEAEIHEFYEKYKAGFVDPERIHIRQIAVNTLSEAEAVRSRVVQGTPFAQVAIESSVGPGKEQGGDVGWFLHQADKDRLIQMGQTPTEGVLFAQLDSVAFTLEPSQISQPVKGPDGRYYLVQLEERKPSRQQAELEVHDAIRDALTLQHVQEQLQQLRSKAKIEEFQDRVGLVEQ